MTSLKIEWLDGGRERQGLADPSYPDGVHVVERAEAAKNCFTKLPYSAPRCGQWSISCGKCGKRVLITAAGRADDPRSIAVACTEPAP
jgi:hypothetical protein